MTVVVDEAALEGPDVLPAGAELAAALDALDPAGTIGQDAAGWMRAAFRQRNHHDWLLLVTLREACSARAGTTERVELDEFAPKIAAASLGWTTGMATARLDVAVGVLERMPALGERMRAGALELAKATQFVTGLQGLTDAQARAVVAALLDDAPDLGLGELRDRILDAGYAVDQVWGANRLAAATARARVTAETAPSGAVNLCGRDLPPELAQDAKARLRTLALAVRARLRAAGHKIGLGFVEARVFVRLMDGTQAGLPDTEIIAAVTAELSHLPATHGPEPPRPRRPRRRGRRPWRRRSRRSRSRRRRPERRRPERRGPRDGGPNDDGPNDGGPNDEGRTTRARTTRARTTTTLPLTAPRATTLTAARTRGPATTTVNPTSAARAATARVTLGPTMVVPAIAAPVMPRWCSHPGPRSGWPCPPCSASTSSPAPSPASAPSPPGPPAPQPSPTAAPRGTSSSTTSRATWNTSWCSAPHPMRSAIPDTAARPWSSRPRRS